MTTRTAALAIFLLVGAAFGASLIFYTSLPARLPIHWDIDGNVDGWAGRPFAVLIVPSLGLLFLFFVLAGEWLSPRHFKVSTFRSSFNSLMVVCAALMVYMHALVLAAGLRPGSRYGRWIIAGLFLFFAWIGNLLGKTRPNFWIGIRTPWTLASDAVWIATHRFGARVFMLVGILGAIGAFAGFPAFIQVTLIVIAIVVPVIYSLRVSKKLEKESESGE